MIEVLLFAAGVAASLAASWLLVSRLERLGERAGFSEAWLGLVAALAPGRIRVSASPWLRLSRGLGSCQVRREAWSTMFVIPGLVDR